MTEKKTDALVQRINRAVEGLKRGKYSVHSLGSGRWRVDNEHASYDVTHDGDGWHCSCPDHQERGMTCKHIFMTYLTTEQAAKGKSLDDAAKALKARLEGRESHAKPETDRSHSEDSTPESTEMVREVLKEILVELRLIREAMAIVASEVDNDGAGLRKLFRDAIIDADLYQKGHTFPPRRPKKVSLAAGARL